MGAVFALFAGTYYWFTKITGVRYHEELAQATVLDNVFWRKYNFFSITFPGYSWYA